MKGLGWGSLSVVPLWTLRGLRWRLGHGLLGLSVSGGADITGRIAVVIP